MSLYRLRQICQNLLNLTCSKLSHSYAFEHYSNRFLLIKVLKQFYYILYFNYILMMVLNNYVFEFDNIDGQCGNLLYSQPILYYNITCGGLKHYKCIKSINNIQCILYIYYQVYNYNTYNINILFTCLKVTRSELQFDKFFSI